MTSLDTSAARWTRQPNTSSIGPHTIEIVTEPHTDLWQRTHYGFERANAPLLQWASADDFRFTVRCRFDYRTQYDQCGVIIYLDERNWFKASVEYENAAMSRLGSVLTRFGYSDWASHDVPTPEEIWFRLSRRNTDWLLEYAFDGRDFRQMRIFHLAACEPLDKAPDEAQRGQAPMALPFGVYACSPGDSRFHARFSDMTLAPHPGLSPRPHEPEATPACGAPAS